MSYTDPLLAEEWVWTRGLFNELVQGVEITSDNPLKFEHYHPHKPSRICTLLNLSEFQLLLLQPKEIIFTEGGGTRVQCEESLQKVLNRFMRCLASLLEIKLKNTTVTVSGYHFHIKSEDLYRNIRPYREHIAQVCEDRAIIRVSKSLIRELLSDGDTV